MRALAVDFRDGVYVRDDLYSNIENGRHMVIRAIPRTRKSLFCALGALVVALPGEALPPSIIPYLGTGSRSPNYTVEFVAGESVPASSACSNTAVSSTGYGHGITDGSLFPQNCGSATLVSSTIPGNLSLQRLGVTLNNETVQQMQLAICALTAIPAESTLKSLVITGPSGTFFNSSGAQEGFITGTGSFANCVQWSFTFLTPMVSGATYTAAIDTDGSWH